MSNQLKIQNLKRDIIRYKIACKSEWPRPIDFMNLIDAQHALRSLEIAEIRSQDTSHRPEPITWFKRIKYWKGSTLEEASYA